MSGAGAGPGLASAPAAALAQMGAEASAGGERALLRFVTRFLLPLVRGGPLHVGRPLGPRLVERMAAASAQLDAEAEGGALVLAASAAERRAADGRVALAVARHAAARRLLPAARVPALDETTLRLGAAVHNLLLLNHPAIEGRGAEGRQTRVAAIACELASVGAPPSAEETVARHSLLARLPEIARSDRVVHFWLGRRSFVGRRPPRRVTALPSLRKVRIDTVRRGWLREIGMPIAARPAFLALCAASPLGETEDLFRLDPPLAWSRILPVLRFPALGRQVAGRVVEAGVLRAGDVLADALFRFVSGHDPPGGAAPNSAAIAFAIRFLAHALWLDLLFGSEGAATEAGAAGAVAAAGEGGATAGLDLAVVLVAAQRISSALVWPPDVAAGSDLGRRFIDRMAGMASLVRARRSPRFDTAVAIAGLAAQSLR